MIYPLRARKKLSWGYRFLFCQQNLVVGIRHFQTPSFTAGFRELLSGKPILRVRHFFGGKNACHIDFPILI
jgi:hypothetical protein